jgi:hypothetical protein
VAQRLTELDIPSTREHILSFFEFVELHPEMAMVMSQLSSVMVIVPRSYSESPWVTSSLHQTTCPFTVTHRACVPLSQRPKVLILGFVIKMVLSLAALLSTRVRVE